MFRAGPSPTGNRGVHPLKKINKKGNVIISSMENPPFGVDHPEVVFSIISLFREGHALCFPQEVVGDGVGDTPGLASFFAS